MTREEKLRLHLESVMLEDLPEGTHVNAATLDHLCQNATEEQKERAFARALARSPLLLNDERLQPE